MSSTALDPASPQAIPALHVDRRTLLLLDLKIIPPTIFKGLINRNT